MSVWRFIPWPREDPCSGAGVWIESLGTRDCSHHNSRSDHDFLCIHLLRKGRIRFQTGFGEDVVLGPGSLFTIWPRIPCRLAPERPATAGQVEMDWVRLLGPLRRDFAGLVGTPADRPWSRAANPAQAQEILRRLQTLAADDPPQADLLAVSLLYRFAAACGQWSSASAEERPLAQRVRQAMEEHIGSAMNVADYARAFRISRSKLFQIFKDAFGRSPIQVLTEIRIGSARELLAATTLTVKEVALVCGYRDPFYFSREFRRRVGVSPQRFRAEGAGGERRAIASRAAGAATGADDK